MKNISIISAKPLNNFRLEIQFSDQKKGVVDMNTYLWGEAFEPLKNPSYFKKVQLNNDIGTICWPNGVAISPESLYKNTYSI